MRIMKYNVITLCLIWVITPMLQTENGEQPRVLVRGELESELAPHRTGNVYAPDVHRHGTNLWMWYGGQGSDGHDRIHLAESSDGARWEKLGVVIDNGSANHVNDPSVVRVGDSWWMFYTVAEKGEQDQIAAATSTDGRNWRQHGVVFPVGHGKVWDSGKVGRPSVIFQDGLFYMWYDGQPSQAAVQSGDALSIQVRAEGRAVGYAESVDGLKWERRSNPVFQHGAGAVHVAKYSDRYILLYESGQGTMWASSADRVAWQNKGILKRTTGAATDAYGHVTPCFHVDNNSTTLYFGAASRKTWDGNSIMAIKVTIP